MLAVIAVVCIYLFGAGSTPITRSVTVASEAECHALVQKAQTEYLKQADVRDVRGVCVELSFPKARDKS